MVMRSHEELQALAEAHLMFFPEKMLTRLGDVKNVYSYRHSLKQIGYNEKILSHLVFLTVEALDAHRRFRVQDTIKVLRSQIVHSDSPLPDAIVRGLFKIYQRLILSCREETRWHLSRLIKDQNLSEEALEWLVQNWRKSDHVVNRLLLYPQPHPLVEQWALERYENHEMDSRLSEIVALLLPRYGIDKFRGLAPDSLAWAIVKSRIDHSAKLGFLRRIIDDISTTAVVDIAKRLDSPELIELCLGSK